MPGLRGAGTPSSGKILLCLNHKHIIMLHLCESLDYIDVNFEQPFPKEAA